MLIKDIVNLTITVLSFCFSALRKLLPAVLVWFMNFKVRKNTKNTRPAPLITVVNRKDN